MRRKRERIEAVVFDMATQCHLETGDCLLAGHGHGCACGIVGADGALREEIARRMWQEHRDEILAAWDKPEKPWGLRFD